MNYTVGEAARAAGVSTRAIRHYEERGLLPQVARSPSGYRLFSDEAVEVLAFIRRGRTLGLSLDAIAEIMLIAEKGAPCERTRALLAERLAEIDRTIADLRSLRETITTAATIAVDQTAATRCAIIESVRTPASGESLSRSHRMP